MAVALIRAARHLLVGAVLLASLGTGALRAGTLVEFPNVAGQPYPQQLLGYLARPDGSGPFAAVVVLHGCQGLSSGSIGLADQLKALGYVALAVDSFGVRNSVGECGKFFVGQEIDAFAALDYLSRQSFVDPRRVAVLGNSMGGSSALLAVQRGALEQRFARKFRAAVAYYPYCGYVSSVMTAPILILIGEADDWTSAVLCGNMAARPHDDGASIELVVYPGARHGFNFPQLQPGTIVLGHRLEYDGPAATDAWQRVRIFLAATLADR